MKTQNLLVIIVLFFSLMFSSCIYLDLDNICVRGEGPIVEQELSIADFNEIDLGASFNVVISQGPVQKVLAVGNRNIIDHLNTNVYSGQWNAGFEHGCFSDFDLTVYVTVPSIDQIKLSGSGDVELEDFNQENDLTVKITGSGDFTMNEFETAKNLYANLNSSGCFYANKDVTCFNTVTVHCSGSGDFKGFSIITKDCSAKTSGSGNCFVYAEDNLTATTSGSGDIHYKGNPLVDSHSSGSGKIVHY